MKKGFFLAAIVILIFSVNIFGQPKRKKVVRVLPEVDDQVLVSSRKKQVKPKVFTRKKSTKRKAKPLFDEADALFGKRRKSSNNKYANQEVSYRTKSRRKKVSGVTHDPEFENWANRKRKLKVKSK